MYQGSVIRAAGGYFTVRADGGKDFTCRARGNLKRGKQSLIVGDRVLFSLPDRLLRGTAAEGVIEEMLPRFNCLSRPVVANVDQLVVIMSLRQPQPDWQLASRLLVMAEKEKMQAALCLNKCDLVTAEELARVAEDLQPYPYPIIFTSALKGRGLKELTGSLEGCCSVFAGPSGAGKSSLLNALQPGLALQTGNISEKIKRGRHTTRQAELIPLKNGGIVVDTPGFTRLDFAGLAAEEMPGLFPEFELYSGQCAFRDCRHRSEPHCAVRDHLGETVNRMRYEHYRYFMNELVNRQEVY